jgi:hypothetical protein
MISSTHRAITALLVRLVIGTVVLGALILIGVVTARAS